MFFSARPLSLAKKIGDIHDWSACHRGSQSKRQTKSFAKKPQYNYLFRTNLFLVCLTTLYFRSFPRTAVVLAPTAMLTAAAVAETPSTATAAGAATKLAVVLAPPVAGAAKTEATATAIAPNATTQATFPAALMRKVLRAKSPSISMVSWSCFKASPSSFEVVIAIVRCLMITDHQIHTPQSPPKGFASHARRVLDAGSKDGLAGLEDETKKPSLPYIRAKTENLSGVVGKKSKNLHFFASPLKKRFWFNKIPPPRISSRWREFYCKLGNFVLSTSISSCNCRNCEVQTAFSCRFSTQPPSPGHPESPSHRHRRTAGDHGGPKEPAEEELQGALDNLCLEA